MNVEFDHVFIWSSLGGNDEATRLTSFGLTEGPANTHPGQGTACRRFFFANFYIELLWVCDAEEAQSKAARPTGLWERWQNRASGACPFGLIFRPRIQHKIRVPFCSWEYRPAYLPGSLSIHVAINAHVLTEPMLFYLPFARRPDAYPTAKQPPLRHSVSLREVNRVQLTTPHADNLSPEMTAVTGPVLVQMRTGLEYLVELGFDGELRGLQTDFRPALPLLFRW